MQKQAPPLSISRLRSLAGAWNLFFYCLIVLIVLTAKLPPFKRSFFILTRMFAQEQESFFRSQDPGLPFAIFKSYAPPSGEYVSFLTDSPHDPHRMDSERFQAARGELAPLLLNAAPGEKIAFFACSNDVIAETRAKAEGYRFIKMLGNGKGIAERVS